MGVANVNKVLLPAAITPLLKNLPLVLALWTPFLRQHIRESVCRRALGTCPGSFVGLPRAVSQPGEDTRPAVIAVPAAW